MLKVVSLNPAITETLIMLGLSSNVAGCSRWCRMPPAREVPVVGDYLEADAQLIRSLMPDVVMLSSGVQEKLAEKLKAAGLPVRVIPLPKSVEEIIGNVRRIGSIVEAERQAEKLCRIMKAAADALKLQLPPLTTYVELWLGSPVACGEGTHVVDGIKLLGLKPCCRLNGFHRGQLHRLLHNPPHLVMAEYPASDKKAASLRYGWLKKLGIDALTFRPDTLSGTGPGFLLRSLPQICSRVRDLTVKTPQLQVFYSPAS